MSEIPHASKPLIVGIGGTTRAESSTDRALRVALLAADESGARTHLFGGSFLERLPHFAAGNSERNIEQRQFVDTVRQADGVIIASPGYHGGVSGLVKNALDLLEDLREDERSYLDGRAVGCIVTAAGWQASVNTLAALRAVVHALRGWPTPFGVTINTSQPVFDSSGHCVDSKVAEQLGMVAHQVVDFARQHRR